MKRTLTGRHSNLVALCCLLVLLLNSGCMRVVSTTAPGSQSKAISDSLKKSREAAATAKSSENPAVASADAPKTGTTTTVEKPKSPDVIYAPTPPEIAEKMLELADVKKNDVVYDLGCGDGRILIAAAKKYGARCVGIDIDPVLVREAQENVRQNKLESLITIKQGDMFASDFSDATVVALYLLPELNVRLLPQLQKLKPGARVVSNGFDIKGVKPAKTVMVTPSGQNQFEHTVYLWTVPFESEGKPTK